MVPQRKSKYRLSCPLIEAVAVDVMKNCQLVGLLYKVCRARANIDTILVLWHGISRSVGAHFGGVIRQAALMINAAPGSHTSLLLLPAANKTQTLPLLMERPDPGSITLVQASYSLFANGLLVFVTIRRNDRAHRQLDTKHFFIQTFLSAIKTYFLDSLRYE